MRRDVVDVDGCLWTPRRSTCCAATEAGNAGKRAAAGPAWHDEATDRYGTARSDLVFTWEDGRLINPERFTRWYSHVLPDQDADVAATLARVILGG